jgi:hypothetical protein
MKGKKSSPYAEGHGWRLFFDWASGVKVKFSVITENV